MSTSIILLDRSFNANDVDIMVFEHSFFIPSLLLGSKRKINPAFLLMQLGITTLFQKVQE